MKYVIVRCEDRTSRIGNTPSLLAGAKTPHLQHLAHAGSAGVVRTQAEDTTSDRLSIHGTLLGLQPGEPDALAGRWYAAAIDVPLREGESAWCSELVTQREGRIVDPRAGDIPTTESRVLIAALNEELGSDTRRWEVGDGSSHILIVRDGVFGSVEALATRPPESVVGRMWREALPQGAEKGGLQLLIEQASKILGQHAINRVRVDLGENPANLVWVWGSASRRPGRNFSDRTGLTGAVLSRSFPMRGFARSLGLGWQEGPRDLEANSLRSISREVDGLIRRHDIVYLHLQVETLNPAERFCAMERIDELVLKPLTGLLADLGPWRLLTAVDERANAWVPFVAIGTGLPQRPSARLGVEPFIEHGLTFDDGPQLFAWLTSPHT